ncbi:peptidyl-tRNA hydrolase PTH2-domain-containing protein [Catenaria anguillulae PL171]|uniref:peptidyl-tRNA hydrolase n=1 Tax=Catenaria anguillulae PL171 TaxID=765915 RepID=A0A1Y2HFA7_9FUNG|nr:peptidyl-tRNA hydrolase PTH2-domain-containing protein [Catenaria anguillulae PL171]
MSLLSQLSSSLGLAGPYSLPHLVAVAVVSGSIAFLSAASSTSTPQEHKSESKSKPKPKPKTKPKPKADAAAASSSSSSSASDSDDYEDSDFEAPPAATDGSTPLINAAHYSDFKMVLVVRTDLPMTKGKVAAQCCHACLAAYKHGMLINPAMVSKWERIGQAKVALKCTSEQEMLELQSVARALGLPAQSIRDAGRTQIEAGTRTVLAVGPGPVEVVNQVTGHLKLY